ncbi:MAG: hypothetical protein AAGI07_04115 [Bacteroidota bacterium]
MKKIEAYGNIDEAVKALDNGGRFYNILTKKNDGIISEAELGKVGGIFNDTQKMILFFELSTSKLNQTKKEALISKMEEDLRTTFGKYKPQELLPSEADEKGMISSNAIIKGIPKLIETKSDFNGFIMVPIIANNVTTFVMVPIIDQYDIYELRDEQFSKTFLIAHAKSSNKLPHKKMKVAGVLKELKANSDEKEASKKILETIYFQEID